jgi:hypothetical protein
MPITVKQREAKILEFAILADGVAVDLSTATLSFAAKLKLSDTEFSIEKSNADFDVAEADAGIVSVLLDADDLDLAPGTYRGELRIEFSDGAIDKSDTMEITVVEAITD